MSKKRLLQAYKHSLCAITKEIGIVGYKKANIDIAITIPF
jgi:hypothetical protein